jgi:tRNA-splicing endonuclease subunit Sen2
MADTTSDPPIDDVTPTPDPIAEVVSAGPQPTPRLTGPKPPLNKLYALPAPLRTFPLPTFVPHNPLSLIHILYVWVSQAINPPSSNFEPLYRGFFSSETRSIHVTETRSIRGLWEQGFYGKGSLSRSEPNWLTGEVYRRGSKSTVTSEEYTRERRAQRQQMKWERARLEREAIDRKLHEEAALSTPSGATTKGDSSIVQVVPGKFSAAPVGPLEILALPNCLSPSSFTEVEINGHTWEMADDPFTESSTRTKIAHLNGSTTQPPFNLKQPAPLNGSIHGHRMNGHTSAGANMKEATKTDDELARNITNSDKGVVANGRPNEITHGISSPLTPRIKQQKSVRFSPTVERNTFIQTEPPSPDRSVTKSTFEDIVVVDDIPTAEDVPRIEEEPLVIKDQEHLQLTLEEAFFLSYALGALIILDPTTNSPISNRDLFTLCRRTSYFPPLSSPALSPDDPFMVNYVAFHHFRSLGWVVRSGIKFSVDFMLYQRGPVFTHAEFAVVILPSYSDPYWSSDASLQNHVKKKEKRTWAWMSCINRVIAQVRKTLILAYVDIPKPLNLDEEQALGIDGVLGRYKVREVVMRRFLANRARS